MISKKSLMNLFSLASIQGSNALIPIIIYPIILNRIGYEMFSKVTVTEAISTIISSFVMYSFDINGVSKLVGLNFEYDKNEISEIFSNVFYSRIFVFLLFMCLLPIGFFLLDKESFYLLIFWLLIPLSNIFQSLWFFQGLELNYEVALVALISKLVAISILLVSITEANDFFLIPIILGCSYLVGAIISWVMIIGKYGITLLRLKDLRVEKYLYEGKEIFIGNVSVILFRDFNIILLGIFNIDSLSISIYSIAEKIIKGLQASIRPLNQFFFPKVILKLTGINKPNKEAFILIIKQTIPQLLFLLLISIILHIAFHIIANNTSFIQNYPNKYRIYNIAMFMNISIFLGVLNFMLGSAGLNFLDDRKYFSFSIFIVGVSSIVISVIFIPLLFEYGAAISFIFGEFLLLFLIIKRFYSTSELSKK